MGKFLKYSRLIIAVVLTTLLTLAIAVPSPLTRSLGGWIAKVQIVPLALSFAMGWFILWILLALFFGRIYCSTICPMGALQDLAIRISRLFGRKSSHDFHFHQANNQLRYTMLAFIVAMIMLGVTIVLTLIDPYSGFARMVLNFSHPLQATLLGLAISLISLLVIGAFAWRRGRLWCNTFCPVGTTLGMISRYSIFHIDIDTDLCLHCRKCEHVCKAECIDLDDHVVDSSRCVNCFNCLTVCSNKAIKYTSNRKQLSIPMMQRISTTAPSASMEAHVEMSKPANNTKAPRKIDRRTFLFSTIAIGTTVATRPLTTLADEIAPDKSPSQPLRYVTPPGAPSRELFLERCTGCGLCVANCPTHVLKPTNTEYGIIYALHPYKDYDSSYCIAGCSRCTKLCPTGALLPLTKSEKLISKVGVARLIPDNCISVKGYECGQCASACPKSSITMTPRNGVNVPIVNASTCIGCGSCQFICPATPSRAMIVDGIE